MNSKTNNSLETFRKKLHRKFEKNLNKLRQSLQKKSQKDELLEKFSKYLLQEFYKPFVKESLNVNEYFMKNPKILKEYPIDFLVVTRKTFCTFIVDSRKQ